MLEQIAFRMQLKAGHAAEYKRRHDAIWPQLAALLADAGIRDYSIFLDQADGALFAVLWRSKEHCMDSLPQQALMQRWWAHMADLMQTEADLAPATVPLLPMFQFAAPSHPR